jgi:hypothetical protein
MPYLKKRAKTPKIIQEDWSTRVSSKDEELPYSGTTVKQDLSQPAEENNLKPVFVMFPEDSGIEVQINLITAELQIGTTKLERSLETKKTSQLCLTNHG